MGPGASVSLGILRDGSEKTVHVKLGTFPDEQVAEAKGQEGHGKLGVAVQTLTPDVAQEMDVPADHGVVIIKVEPGSAAENAGLQERDVVVSVDGQPVRDANAFRSAVEKATPGDVLRLRVHRGEGYLFVAVRPA